MSGTPRLSLTKTQRATAAGIELQNLCLSMTDDGQVTEQEVAHLRQWLASNAGTNMPAVLYLASVVEQILADGRVTPDELEALQRSLETVLPPEFRKIAVARRREHAARERAAFQAEQAKLKEELRRLAPVARSDFVVAGVFYDNRGAAVEREAEDAMAIELARQPSNPYDCNAISVRLPSGADIGYMPRAEAEYIAGLFDSGHRYEAAIKKILDGRQVHVPVVVAEYFAPDHPKQRGRIARTIPFERSLSAAGGDSQDTLPEPTDSGVVLLIAVGIAVLVILFLLMRPF